MGVSPPYKTKTLPACLSILGEAGTGLQSLAGSLHGKKNRSSTSGDGPFKNHLKLFLRVAAVSPGNAIAPRNPVIVANAIWSLKNNTKG